MAQEEPKLNEIEELKNKCEEYLNGWKRERADFLNYKKEEQLRMESLVSFINGGNALEALPILDNFEIAEKKIPEELKKDENVRGILQTKSQIINYLKGLKLSEIESLGKKFDPNFHESVGEESREGIEPGIVIEEIRKGYLLDGKVVARPAKVKISK